MNQGLEALIQQINDFNNSAHQHVLLGTLHLQLFKIQHFISQNNVVIDEEHKHLTLSVPQAGSRPILISNISIPLNIEFSGGEDTHISLNECSFSTILIEGGTGVLTLSHCKSELLEIRTPDKYKLCFSDLKIAKIRLVEVQTFESEIKNTDVDHLIFRKFSLNDSVFQSHNQFNVKEKLTFLSCTNREITNFTFAGLNLADEKVVIFCNECTFENNITFENATSVLRRLYVKKCEFDKDFSINNSKMKEPLNIEETSIKGTLSLVGLTVYIAEKPRSLHFTKLSVGKLNLLNIVLHGNAYISETTILGSFNFLNVKSEGFLYLSKKSVFGSAEKLESSNLENCRFNTGIFFDDVTANNIINFENCDLMRLRLTNVQFMNNFRIERADDANDEYYTLGLEVRRSVFHRDFRVLQMFVKSFVLTGTTVEGYCSIRKCDFVCPPSIHNSKIMTFLDLKDSKIETPTTEAQHYTDDFRSLKELMKSQGDDRHEMMFSSQELDCRLTELIHIKGKNLEIWGNIFILTTYHMLNGKGRSLVKPLLTLLGGLVLFSAVFWAFLFFGEYRVLEQDKAPFWIQSLTQNQFALSIVKSIQNSTGPLGLFSESSIDFKSEQNLWAAILVRLISFIQICLSSLLIYLTVIGIKRRLRTV